MEEILYVERIEWKVLIRKEIYSGHSLCWIKEMVSYLSGRGLKKVKLVNSEETLLVRLCGEKVHSLQKRKSSRIVDNFAFIHPQFRREPRWGRMHVC